MLGPDMAHNIFAAAARSVSPLSVAEPIDYAEPIEPIEELSA
jgi:hypothetical protein